MLKSWAAAIRGGRARWLLAVVYLAFWVALGLVGAGSHGAMFFWMALLIFPVPLMMLPFLALTVWGVLSRRGEVRGFVMLMLTMLAWAVVRWAAAADGVSVFNLWPLVGMTAVMALVAGVELY